MVLLALLVISDVLAASQISSAQHVNSKLSLKSTKVDSAVNNANK
jgi:hypothetical protein